MAQITLGQLAQQLDAVLLNGNAEQCVTGLAGLAEAGPGQLTFLANASYRSQLATSKAEAVVVGKDISSSDAPMALLQTDNPDLAFAKAAALIMPPPPHPVAPGVHPTAVVASDAVLGSDVRIGAGAVVESGAVIGDRTVLYPQTYVGTGTRIGEDCLLYPGVKIYHQVTIGSRCIFHAGCVIGSDGFGYAWTGLGYYKIPQVGTVVIENDVELGANVTVDRARFGQTRIGMGTKLDNLVQIAHNVKLGPCCAFAAQVGIAGSATIGAGVQMGGQSAVVGHLKVGDGITIVGQSAVSKNIPGRESGADPDRLVWIDTPAMPMKEFLKEKQNIKSLGSVKKKLKDIEARLTQMEEQHAG